MSERTQGQRCWRLNTSLTVSMSVSLVWPGRRAGRERPVGRERVDLILEYAAGSLK
jgi:hypothetical protein